MQQQTILVVDDERMARRGVADLLRSRRYKARLARSGIEAVNKAVHTDVALILMDIRLLEEVDGIEAARRIQIFRPDVPVVFITAFSDDAEYQRRAREADIRVAGWVEKPIVDQNRDLLLSIVDEELAKAQLRSSCETVATQFGMDSVDAIVEEIGHMISPPAASTKILKQLDRAICETEKHFTDIQQRQFAFAQFKTTAMEHLWDAYRRRSKYHRQLALLIRMSVRKLSSLQLTEEHLAALKALLERLSRDEVTSGDVAFCKKTLRRSGIETLIRLGDKTDELLEAYDEGVTKE